MDAGGTQLVLAGWDAVELKTALAAERASRAALDRHLAEATHDLRGGLAAIAGYAEMLEESGPTSLPAGEIGRRIARLAIDLCDMTSVIGGRGAAAPQRRRISARALFRSCAEAIEPRCREKGLRLHVDLPPAGVLVRDPVSVCRITQNLLTNAVRYTDRGEIRLSVVAEGAALRIEVRDTGIGIRPEDHGRIFEVFCRLDEGRRRAPLGTGLGLATVQRLCERLGGRVRVESAKGTGSRFEVVLPRARVRRMEPEVARLF